jgi:hypothetical protein
MFKFADRGRFVSKAVIQKLCESSFGSGSGHFPMPSILRKEVGIFFLTSILQPKWQRPGESTSVIIF